MAEGAALGIVSQHEEHESVRLPVEGELPGWLGGKLLRTVPAAFEVGGRRIGHWFDGLALLNAFTFDDGRVSYASRFLQSDSYRAARDEGRLTRRGFANDPCVSIFKRAFSLFSPSAETLTDNGNVNIGRLGERFVALTEAPMPVAFDPETLETLGLVEHPDDVGYGHGVPHPHYDAAGAMISSVTTFGARPHYRLYSVDPDTAVRTQLASLAVREPAYMHAFAMTEKHLVLIDQPYVIDPLAIARSGRPLRSLVEYFAWKPARGTRLHVFSRATGHRIRTAETGALFFFHTINAYDEGDDVVIDLAAYADPAIVGAFFLTVLEQADTGFPTARPVRLRVALRDGRVERRDLADLDFELPTIDYARRNARPYRYAYGVGRHADRERSFWDQLVKLDTDGGSTATWREPDTNPSEPVFVARPGGAEEDDGLVLSVVLDQRSERSFLLVLDAARFTEIARAWAPQRIPLGFHGQHTGNLPPTRMRAV